MYVESRLAIATEITNEGVPLSKHKINLTHRFLHVHSSGIVTKTNKSQFNSYVVFTAKPTQGRRYLQAALFYDYFCNVQRLDSAVVKSSLHGRTRFTHVSVSDRFLELLTVSGGLGENFLE